MTRIAPTPGDAKARMPVSFQGRHGPRTGRLIYWPVAVPERHGGRASKGKRARVELPGGKVVSVDPTTVRLVEGQTG